MSQVVPTPSTPLSSLTVTSEYMAAIPHGTVEAELHRSLSLLRATLESTADGILVVDRDGRIASFNQKMAEMWGLSPALLASGDDSRAIESALQKLRDPDKFVAKVRELYDNPNAESFDVLELKDGRTFERYSQPQRIGTESVGRVWSFRDVTLRVRAEERARSLAHEHEARVAAEEAARRASLIAEASRVLSASFDYHTTLAALVRLPIPAIADYCTLDVIGDDGAMVRLGEAHADSPQTRILHALGKFGPTDITEDHPIRQVLNTGRSILIPFLSEGMIQAAFQSDEQRKLVMELNPQSLICVPLVASGRTLGTLTLATSISGRRLGTKDLELASEFASRAAVAVEHANLFHEAQRATRARDEILAVVAHDLRNPLNTIMMASSLLAESGAPETSPERRNALIVRRAADSMQHLIQDLIEVKRMERGRLSVEPKPERISAIVGETVEMLRQLAAGSEIELTVSVAPELPLVFADYFRIQQVLSNIVGNAVKFTPRGGSITVTADQKDNEVRVTVADTGPGIAPEQVPHVFGRFWQSNPKDMRGMGLGLAIAKGLVDAHGGRIWVESTVGAGTKFTFTIPLAPPSHAERARAQPGTAR